MALAEAPAPPGDRADADDPEFLSHGRDAGARAWLQSRQAAASQQGNRDAVMSLALINGRVLTDEGFAEGRVVVLSAGRIEAILGHDEWQAERTRRGSGNDKQSVH